MTEKKKTEVAICLTIGAGIATTAVLMAEVVKSNSGLAIEEGMDMLVVKNPFLIIEFAKDSTLDHDKINFEQIVRPVPMVMRDAEIQLNPLAFHSVRTTTSEPEVMAYRNNLERLLSGVKIIKPPGSALSGG